MRTHASRSLRLGAGALLAASAVALVGCSSNGDVAEQQVQQHQYFVDGNLTPVATSSFGSKTQNEIMAAFSIDTNLRRAHDDGRRLFFFDRPLRLSMYPTVY